MSYYLAKSNPKKFDLEGFLLSYQNEDVNWTALKDSAQGDALFIGLCGSKAGIYAMAQVSSDHSTWETWEPAELDEFWLDRTKRAGYYAQISNLIRLQRPLLEGDIRARRELERVANLLRQQGAVKKLDEQEAAVLEELIQNKSSAR